MSALRSAHPSSVSPQAAASRLALAHAEPTPAPRHQSPITASFLSSPINVTAWAAESHARSASDASTVVQVQRQQCQSPMAAVTQQPHHWPDQYYLATIPDWHARRCVRCASRPGLQASRVAVAKMPLTTAPCLPRYRQRFGKGHQCRPGANKRNPAT